MTSIDCYDSMFEIQWVSRQTHGENWVAISIIIITSSWVAFLVSISLHMIGASLISTSASNLVFVVGGDCRNNEWHHWILIFIFIYTQHGNYIVYHWVIYVSVLSRQSTTVVVYKFLSSNNRNFQFTHFYMLHFYF